MRSQISSEYASSRVTFSGSSLSSENPVFTLISGRMNCLCIEYASSVTLMKGLVSSISSELVDLQFSMTFRTLRSRDTLGTPYLGIAPLVFFITLLRRSVEGISPTFFFTIIVYSSFLLYGFDCSQTLIYYIIQIAMVTFSTALVIPVYKNFLYTSSGCPIFSVRNNTLFH